MNNSIKIKKLTKNAKLPERKSCESAGLDLYSAEESLLIPGAHTLVKADIAIQLPKFSYGRIAAKPGLAIKGIIPIGGVIDSGL